MGGRIVGELYAHRIKKIPQALMGKLTRSVTPHGAETPDASHMKATPIPEYFLHISRKNVHSTHFAQPLSNTVARVLLRFNENNSQA